MRMSIEEKKILFAFGCPDRFNTITRLNHVAMLTVDPGTKKLIRKLALKLLGEGVENWYRCFFYNFRIEMEGYNNAQRIIHRAEISTNNPEDYYCEAD